jgi:LuxR family transcriptional regulator, maltose regulon positive regulatory protein
MSPTVSASRLAKTTRPKSSHMFRRERLLRVLEGSRSSVCTWVEGPPGSGKTSLLASFVNAAQLDCLWYQVDPEDGDPAAFFACMLVAARRTLGDCAADTLPPPTPDALFGLTGYARAFFAQLFALAPKLTVVMDDYHEAPLECPLHDILRVAVEQAPAEALLSFP